jgi:hypothetical protein
MTTTHVIEVHGAVMALLPLLTPAERASLAGAILSDAGVDGDTVGAFAAEFDEDSWEAFQDEVS